MSSINNISSQADPFQQRNWNKEVVFDNAKQHFDSMLIGIDEAIQSINLAVYIFELDEVGNEFLHRLQQAAQHGVLVRVLVDGVGSAHSVYDLGKKLSAVGAEFHIYHPLPWYWDSYRWSVNNGRWLEKFWHFVTLLNRRDHRKFMVVDGSSAWCGNFNLCADHLGQKQPWRDYGTKVKGQAVSKLLNNFDNVWLNQKTDLSEEDHQQCCSNISLRMRWHRNRNLALRIRNAKQRVWICAAYFSPSRSIIRAIRAARSKNIDVRLIVAGHSDIRFFPLLTSTYYADLLKMGVSVYRYDQGILHAKALLVDQQCVLGSTNLNHRSFYHDLELDVVLSQPNSIKSFEQWLLGDMKGAHVVSMKDVSLLSRSFWLGWLPRLLRYWM